MRTSKAIAYALPCLAALHVAGVSPPAKAAAPSVLLEDSESFALDNYVRAFRVPVVASNGTVKYYDVTITLGLNGAGVPSTATVAAALSPVVTTGAVVPGTYKTVRGDVCVVTNMTLTNGRIQSFFACKSTTTGAANLAVATGTISAGLPYLQVLVADGIPKLADNATYTWGLATNEAGGYITLGSCSFYLQSPLGAKSNGSQVVMSAYYNGTNTYKCDVTLTKQ